MCFRSEETDPTQQPIRITQTDEAHGSESFGDVSHLPPKRTRTNSSAHHTSSTQAPASLSDKDRDQPQTQKPNAKGLRKIKANDKDIANKMAMRPPDFIGAAGGF
ncbi:hypothetical protein PV05_09580 [Exophiala xenobiotica]|uniref:Uncharacterized protein n=1 Tax=Exophiala xenobiotica TaxID=348802 RepID=A0A0D2E5P8_9EURO|nr:uncharacterized protein PV05_09580 [Exophiala xenobiotica]KIW50793.1 hypothetical protein PV05_09580 [Exophiala xenobiotica]